MIHADQLLLIFSHFITLKYETFFSKSCKKNIFTFCKLGVDKTGNVEV